MEPHILPCPSCGVGINATLKECPICKSATHFAAADAAASTRVCPACGEDIPAAAVFCPLCGERVDTPLEPKAAAVPPKAPRQSAPPAAPKPTAPVPPEPPQEKKSKMTPIIVGLFVALGVAAAAVLVFTLLNKGGNSESEPESVTTNLAMEHTLDSLRTTLPVAAQEVAAYTDDTPALFYLFDDHLHRIDGNTLEDETIDFKKANRDANIDYRNGGIMEARQTKDERYLFIHAVDDGDTQSEALYRYDVKTGKVNILGFGYSITDTGSGYVIKGPNSEKRVDAYGNIVGDRDPGLDDRDGQSEKDDADQPRTSKPSKPRVDETPQTEVIHVEPERVPTQPVQPAEPPAPNNGTGFHLEEI